MQLARDKLLNRQCHVVQNENRIGASLCVIRSVEPDFHGLPDVWRHVVCVQGIVSRAISIAGSRSIEVGKSRQGRILTARGYDLH